MTSAVTGFFIRVGIWLLMIVAWLDRTLRPNRPFPRDPEQLRQRQAWLLDVLRGAGALEATDELVTVDIEAIKQNEAFRSQVAQVDVRFRRADGADGALALIAKFAPVPVLLREYAIYILQENHVKEAAVYAELARDPALPTAMPYYVGVHWISGGFCVLIERLVDAVEVPEADGCPADLAITTVDAMAALHARFWGDEATAAAAIRRTPPNVIDWLAAQLPGPDAPLFAAMLRSAWHHDSVAPSTVQHGDARVGNQLFVPDLRPGAGEGARRCVLIDWQAARRGKGVFDVVYFLVLSVEPEVRRRHGRALLERYHQALCDHGVQGYSLEAMLDDASMAALLVLGFVTLPLMSAEASTTAENTTGIAALGTAWARRMVAVVEELDFDAVARRCGVDGAALRAAFGRSNDGAVVDFPAAAADRAASQAFVAAHGPGLFRPVPGEAAGKAAGSC